MTGLSMVNFLEPLVYLTLEPGEETGGPPFATMCEYLISYSMTARPYHHSVSLEQARI